MNSELLYQLALTMVPNVGDAHAKMLIKEFGSASAVFKAKPSALEKIPGIHTPALKSLKEFNGFDAAEKELQFVKKYNIKPLFLTDPDYPQRLLNCYDSPSLLFYKGSANLNASKVLAIVGTRSYSEYGKQFTEKLIADLADEDILIISGLAFGIDTIAHKASLKNNLKTVGVVGHGLDKIYPAENTSMAKEMIQEGGGIASEFFSGTKPDRHNFPLRNRIVAGLSDATVVVETLVKGGSMITAKLADSYNRDVFAVPGRTTDKTSSGCNYLIQHNKAMLLNTAEDLLEVMGWKQKKKKKTQPQRELFVELSEEERKIIELLQGKDAVHIDEINLKSGLSSSVAAAAMLNLELQNLIAALPGKRYKMVE
jgi:DNA processing protein